VTTCGVKRQVQRFTDLIALGGNAEITLGGNLKTAAEMFILSYELEMIFRMLMHQFHSFLHHT